MMDINIIKLQTFECMCGICGEWGEHNHAVGWYEEAVQEDIGSTITLPNGSTGEVGGRTVCEKCHDDFYGIKALTEGE